ncbi:MAG: low affinity iron permease family protein [Hyphomicrobiales bacterium]
MAITNRSARPDFEQESEEESQRHVVRPGSGSDGTSAVDYFRRLAQVASKLLGTPWAFVGAVGLVILWALSGPVFGFSSTWQLVINTSTTIVTFLMVFLLQNTQNRDTMAMQLKLDELLRGTQGARTGLANLEEMSDEDLAHLQKEFERLSKRHGADLEEEAEDIVEEISERQQRE